LVAVAVAVITLRVLRAVPVAVEAEMPVLVLEAQGHLVKAMLVVVQGAQLVHLVVGVAERLKLATPVVRIVALLELAT
jgi:hypothetical protein